MNITKGKIIGAQKICLYGVEGIGKSTFAAQFPNPIFIDTEGSTKHMDVARLPKPTSWTMLMESVKYVKANPAVCQTLVIDTADWAEQLCLNHICSDKGIKGIEDLGYGRGYVYLAEEFGRLLNLLSDVVALGINVVFTAHAQMRKFEQPDETGAYDRWELKLQKKTAPLLKEWADMVLFANYKTLVVNVDNQGATKGKNKAQGGKRVMYAAHHPCWDAKNRHGLPDEMPFEYKQIAHCIPAKQAPAPTPTPKPDTVPVPDAPPPAPQKTTPIEPMVRYWHSEKARGVAISQTAEEDETFKADPDLKEITKAEYERLKAEYEKTAAAPTVPQKDDLAGVPKALADLMALENVTVEEIQRAVGSKGYYPDNTPISNYDPGFVDGVLIGAWTQVLGMIKELREVENHFNKEAK